MNKKMCLRVNKKTENIKRKAFDLIWRSFDDRQTKTDAVPFESVKTYRTTQRQTKAYVKATGNNTTDTGMVHATAHNRAENAVALLLREADNDEATTKQMPT